MKAIKVNETTWRRYNWLDWVKGKGYSIGCAMLIVIDIVFLVKIIQAIGV